mgnify:CR=1 FL=1
METQRFFGNDSAFVQVQKTEIQQNTFLDFALLVLVIIVALSYIFTGTHPFEAHFNGIKEILTISWMAVQYLVLTIFELQILCKAWSIPSNRDVGYFRKSYSSKLISQILICSTTLIIYLTTKGRINFTDLKLIMLIHICLAVVGAIVGFCFVVTRGDYTSATDALLTHDIIKRLDHLYINNVIAAMVFSILLETYNPNNMDLWLTNFNNKLWPVLSIFSAIYALSSLLNACVYGPSIILAINMYLFENFYLWSKALAIIEYLLLACFFGTKNKLYFYFFTFVYVIREILKYYMKITFSRVREDLLKPERFL